MNQEISILQLILHASIIVQGVMGILLFCSIISWGIIFNKWASLSKAKFDTRIFLKQFHNTKSISALYGNVRNKSKISTVSALFYQGITEYNKLTKQGVTNKASTLENIERSLSSTMDAELDQMENGLSTLATFGSVSPYIGLLGTVWGIMHAFIGLGSSGQTTLSSVAPGIAEALVATAIGLFVAIPSSIFYNKFSADISSLNNKMNKFGDEFLNLINRRLSGNSNNDEA